MKLFVILVLTSLFMVTNIYADVGIDGNEVFLGHTHWLPKKAYIAFDYDSQGKLSGYRVAFKADDGNLFNEWKLKNTDGNSIVFPFVLESTLIIDNKNEVEKNDQWKFERLDGNNQDIPEAYIDSAAFDEIDGVDKYGIGIVNPHLLQEDIIYEYRMGLKEAGGLLQADPKYLQVQLRFRLNIDLSAAAQFSYSKEGIERDFEIGKGWRGIDGMPYGYDEVDKSKNYSSQEIGEYFSFSIEKYRPTNFDKTYSTFFSLDGMEGQWCISRSNVGQKDAKADRVDSIEECFGIKPEQPAEESEIDKVLNAAEEKYGDSIGYRSTETHCWSDPGDNPTCIGGVWIRDYTGGIYGDGTSALIYNPDKRKAYLITEGFWGYYKLFDGYKRLGPPTGDVETLDDGRTRQKFENGYLIWSPKGGLSYPAWGITQYYNNHEVFYPNGGGSGSSTQPTPDDLPVPGLPDFITDKVTIANQSGSKEKYTWKINETAYVHSWTDNIGDANWQGSADKIKVPFYLSKGSKEDDHSEWVRIDRQQISKDNLKINKQPKHEYIKFDLKNWADDSTVLPGRNYNFVVCADRPKDQDNGDGDVKEKHKSNNCSTEAVFYVDYGPPRDVDLIASNLALTGGRSQLQAGEKYGLQVEISNIGTQQPWNGFSSSYEIKGPGTGGVWQRIGEDTSRASSLYPNATHFESMSSEQEVAAPMVGGDYVFRACADYTQAVPETDESNNCTAELPVYVAPPPMPDLITEGLQLTHGRTSLIAGELYGLTVAIRNIGNATPSSNIRTSYAIKGPGTNDQWQQVADDGSDADQLYPGAAQWEEITDEHGAHIPSTPGTYTARACADYHGSVPESDENNNCSEMTFEVQPVPAGSPSIVITNPTHDDDWRSDETDHDVRWDYFDFPEKGHVKVEYSLDGGATWLLIDDNTTNDGKKHWEDMCDFHTIDTHHAYIRVTSLEYSYVSDVSDEFTIDHAKECE